MLQQEQRSGNESIVRVPGADQPVTVNGAGELDNPPSCPITV